MAHSKWEALKCECLGLGKDSVAVDMFAGIVSGLVTVVVINPVDVLR